VHADAFCESFANALRASYPLTDIRPAERDAATADLDMHDILIWVETTRQGPSSVSGRLVWRLPDASDAVAGPEISLRVMDAKLAPQMYDSWIRQLLHSAAASANLDDKIGSGGKTRAGERDEGQ
jgi:hypothetical protein